MAEKYNIAVDGKKGVPMLEKESSKVRRCFLVKPQTYMNLSGESIRELVDYLRSIRKKNFL